MNHPQAKAHRKGTASPGRERRGFTEWLAVKLDIPADILAHGLRLDMRGRNTLTVHGCTDILDYSPCTIRLALADCTLTVCGRRLICTSYLAGAVGIDGCICSLQFEDGEVSP